MFNAIGLSLAAAVNNRKRKRRDPDTSFEEMPPFFTSLSAKTLKPPPAPSRKPSERLQRPSNELDDFLSSDLENSFASTMSLNSPTGSPRDAFVPSSLPEVQSPMAMDISPAPPQKMFLDDASERKASRQELSAARSFGRELGNHALATVQAESASMRMGSNGPQRTLLPSEWLAGFSSGKAENVPAEDHRNTNYSDAMEVDECILPASLTCPTVEDPTIKFPSVQDEKGFSNLFFDGMSSPPPIRPMKRRSLSPEGSPRQNVGMRQRYSNDGATFLQGNFEGSSSPAPPSPSARKFERVASTGGLFGKNIRQPAFLTAPSGTTSISDGPKRLKRPALEGHAISAYSVMEANDDNGFKEMPAPRRAFSATVPPMPSSPGEGDSEVGHEVSSPAAQALAKKQAVRTIRRRDGTDDFRPFAAGGTLRQRDTNPSVQSPLRDATHPANIESPSARWLKGTGLPGFGDNEAHGKILPCERVPEDGLMRIDVQTLDALISGTYDDKIVTYHIIDCRFDYEYQGGHIKGAVNVNTTADIEDYLLGNNIPKPTPTCSGDPNKKTILIFHCEFSAKRAPTFAKALRAKDRAMNNHVYPRIHYPEVYVLKGGYHQYYTESAMYSEPRGYVRMDDPQYARDRRQDLDQFRTKSRFGRTKSYAYGELSKQLSGSQGQQPPNPFSHHQRNSAPGSSSLLPAAIVSRSRRSGEDAPPILSTLDEDSMIGMTSVSSDESGILEGVDKSPCPPPAARAKNGLMGMSMLNFKQRNAGTGRGPLQRAQTVAQIR
ncbi:uncharacterized protein FOMMEDRAFT_145381 [Fomitiporia mediterranea MF3/22]|uniref:uncharacterized protein n=1 Tax=Fomitiporia mediterranea (strain MF3/22) TaxID=694068 RepID=UPI0004408EC6|nr:uncharacterized protein FOMMEDRAFT_145381 [Fomitiporia mediterranea MF3/22]EJD06069.1 hypothetical protein FOMMEDRAFT_145381 [Fomitiporia mediterranea MF3/22]